MRSKSVLAATAAALMVAASAGLAVAALPRVKLPQQKAARSRHDSEIRMAKAEAKRARRAAKLKGIQ